MTFSGDIELVIAMTARCFGTLLALPLGDGVGVLPRLFVSVGLAALLQGGARVEGSLHGGACALEFLIGFLMAAPIRAVVDVSEMVGELIDTARGQTISAVNDPLNGVGASDLAVVGKLGATVAVLWSGAPEALLMSMRETFAALPLGGFTLTTVYLTQVARALASAVQVGLIAAAVWMGAFLLVDLGCAVATRLLQALSFALLAGAVKLLLTLLILHQALLSGGERVGAALRAVAFTRPDGVALSLGEGPPATGNRNPR